VAGLATVATGCSPTVDYLGYDRHDGLLPLSCPTPYQSAYRDVLGRTQTEIDDKLNAAYEQLFHGDAANEAIYFVSGTDRAFIKDILHNGEVRTEGMGLAMLISVLLNRQDEFDRLWRFAASLAYKSGPLQGLFLSRCDTQQVFPPATASSRPCPDPYGLQQFVMALLLARQRWGTPAGSPNYAAEVVHLFEVLRPKGSASNLGVGGAVSAGGAAGAPGGVAGAANAVAGVPSNATKAAPVGTFTFDEATKLVFNEPGPSPLRQTGTALEMPGYYAVWAQVTGDDFYADAAVAARRFLQDVANATTGLVPVRADFDATPVAGWDIFSAEAYRVFLNLVIDRLWGDSDHWQTPQIDAVLRFFTSKGIGTYGAAYSIDGDAVRELSHSRELVLVNGVIASLTTNGDREQYLKAAWDIEAPPKDNFRYYSGLLYLMSNLVLGGRFQLCP
jgi:oligosaccharide reducing-end xylanase